MGSATCPAASSTFTTGRLSIDSSKNLSPPRFILPHRFNFLSPGPLHAGFSPPAKNRSDPIEKKNSTLQTSLFHRRLARFLTPRVLILAAADSRCQDPLTSLLGAPFAFFPAPSSTPPPHLLRRRSVLPPASPLCPSSGAAGALLSIVVPRCRASPASPSLPR